MIVNEDNIFERVKTYIGSPHPEGFPERFNDLALRVFGYQYTNNPVYRTFCKGRGRTPNTVETWKDIPVVPTAAFKEMDLSCGPAEKTFITSGTSGGPKKRGRHLMMRLDLYRAAILPSFSSYLIPDGKKMKMFILTGSPLTWRNSSLSHMMEIIRGEFGLAGSDFYINKTGLEEDRLIADLKSSIRQKTPVFMLGVTLAFHQLLERFRLEGYKFNLPVGSRIMDTGGFKGRNLTLSKKGLYTWYQDGFGIPSHHIVNQYGMTELSSQFYESTLRDYHQGCSGPRNMQPPHWVRTTVVDPETLEEVPKGQIGILRHYDLANCGSVMALQTEDLGHLTGKGFKLIGRADGAEARGCSLLVRDFLTVRRKSPQRLPARHPE